MCRAGGPPGQGLETSGLGDPQTLHILDVSLTGHTHF